MKQTGFREIEHTADRELEVWAPDMAQLLETAARGMNVISGVLTADQVPQSRTIQFQNADPETLLVDFLNELLYFVETERLAFDQFHITETGGIWEARLSGKPIISQEKEIKAVTFHRLEVRRTEQGLTVNIVFDV
ncbi:MAG: archease [Anaerolineae bacterium]|nr:archease [Anaerolineae bacterium]MCZ7554369.1 archease [Anaerolineales bacterium]